MKAKLIVIATLIGFIGLGIGSPASPVIAGPLKIQKIVQSTNHDKDQEINDDQKETEGHDSAIGSDNDRETQDSRKEAEDGPGDANSGSQAGSAAEHEGQQEGQH